MSKLWKDFCFLVGKWRSSRFDKMIPVFTVWLLTLVI